MPISIFKKLTGLTLLELLIALTISLTVLTAIGTLMIDAQRKNNAALFFSYQTRSQQVFQLLDNALQPTDVATPTVAFINDVLIIKNSAQELYFFIQRTNRVTVRGRPIYALYRKEKNQRAEECVEGIDRWQISFRTINTEIRGIHIKIQVNSLTEPQEIQSYEHFVAWG